MPISSGANSWPKSYWTKPVEKEAPVRRTYYHCGGVRDRGASVGDQVPPVGSRNSRFASVSSRPSLTEVETFELSPLSPSSVTPSGRPPAPRPPPPPALPSPADVTTSASPSRQDMKTMNTSIFITRRTQDLPINSHPLSPSSSSPPPAAAAASASVVVYSADAKGERFQHHHHHHQTKVDGKREQSSSVAAVTFNRLLGYKEIIRAEWKKCCVAVAIIILSLATATLAVVLITANVHVTKEDAIKKTIKKEEKGEIGEGGRRGGQWINDVFFQADDDQQQQLLRAKYFQRLQQFNGAQGCVNWRSGSRFTDETVNCKATDKFKETKISAN